MTDRIALTKLHGLGNDFLVRFVEVDGPETDPLRAAALARRVCDRHRGVGADGLLLAAPGPGHDPASWTMTLYNADGSAAEMSGNGIRCFAQAVIRQTGRALPTTLHITTAGGMRVVDVAADPAGDPDAVLASVAMGHPAPGPELPQVGRPDYRTIARSATWDLGNPHVVLEVGDASAVDVAVEGPAWEALFPGGINVHFITTTGPDSVTQVTWERGAGVTQACGTGATAVALSLGAWGVVGDRVDVVMPGGAVRVDLGDEPILHGPSDWIADIEVAA